MSATKWKLEVQVAVERVCAIKVRPRVALARVLDIEQWVYVVLKFLRGVGQDLLEGVVEGKRKTT